MRARVLIVDTFLKKTFQMPTEADSGASQVMNGSSTELDDGRSVSSGEARDGRTGIISDLAGQFSLGDLLGTKRHSPDFTGSRAEHMHWRLRLLTLALAVTTPSWIIVDIATLHGSDAAQVIALRVLVTCIFSAIFLLPVNLHSLFAARLRLGLIILTGAAFYLTSRMLLNGSMDEAGIISGYSFIPYLMVAMLALFPLTVIEGILATAMVFLTVVVAEILLGTLNSLESLGQLWLIGLLSAFSVAAEVTQLQMLLRLYRQATRDPLTGLLNRRALSELIGGEVIRSRRYDRKLSILLFDLDRFKRINDNYGHLIGDLVLKEFSALLLRELRQIDTVGRYGGEEFLVVLPETNLVSATELAERIRTVIEDSPAISAEGQIINYTTSIGVTELTLEEEIESAIKRVDDCLYRAKEEGRNRVVATELLGSAAGHTADPVDIGPQVAEQ